MGKRSLKRRIKLQRQRQLESARKLFMFRLAMAMMAWLLDSKPAFVLHGVATVYRSFYLRLLLEAS